MNQLGFLPEDIKTAVIFSNTPVEDIIFYVRETEYYGEVYSSRIIKSDRSVEKFNYAYTIDFTPFTLPGSYIIEVDGQPSYPFIISDNVFNNVADSLLLFFKTQRCGPTNPYLHLPCHLSDAAYVAGEADSLPVDVTGGWHDAGDYIKFLTTTAFTTYLMIFSYEFDKDKFGFDNDHNDVPDILDEAKIGLDWLLRANYKKDKLITQVQDLRDHTPNWRMPEDDSLKFDRPAFSLMGKNHAGIYAAVMALGARVWKERFLAEEFASKCLNAAENIYQVRNEIPDIGLSNTMAYSDKEFTGKLSLGAIELFLTTNDNQYLTQAMQYAENLYPDFWWSWGNINSLVFYRLAEYNSGYKDSLLTSLQKFNEEQQKSIFNEGTSYTWGTTSALLGISLQAILYKHLTMSDDFDPLAVYQRDFVLGRNRWGLSFITKIGSEYPQNVHSQIAYLNGGNLPGAMVGGPGPKELLTEYKVLGLEKKYDEFNTSSFYYDERSNYLTNEAAISGNATALFVLGYYSNR